MDLHPVSKTSAPDVVTIGPMPADDTTDESTRSASRSASRSVTQPATEARSLADEPEGHDWEVAGSAWGERSHATGRASSSTTQST